MGGSSPPTARSSVYRLTVPAKQTDEPFCRFRMTLKFPGPIAGGVTNSCIPPFTWMFVPAVPPAHVVLKNTLETVSNPVPSTWMVPPGPGLAVPDTHSPVHGHVGRSPLVRA